ncbi:MULTISPECIES: type 2 lanthipeptide synthetase LanM family protein [Clostridium]|uniref:type 2 lanthipeptide synthetase LanM family protein n=1 Tax=Clostridium TaxID=1485 RepID=UPI0008258921|nr:MULTISPECIES: type 2 lanthipeptide synthetase LanM family protein [Clostridium]PJI09179.1 type 2 lantipeptide synthetase LanM [Clostridium sp. CT7]
MELNLAKTLTNEQKIDIYKGNLLKEKQVNEVINDWIKNDNLLSYNNLLKKLSIEGINLQEFASVLNKNNISIDYKKISSTKWYELYKNIIQQYSKSDNFNFYNEESIMYFLNIMIYWCKVQMMQQISKYNNIKIHQDIVNIVLNSIGTNLFNVASKTVIYEYYNQEEKNFRDYNLSNFKNIKGIENFFSKYPVIAKRLVTKVKYLLENYLSSFNRIDRDFEIIESTLGIEIGNIITNIEGNMGDTHEKGKFVIQYEFNNKTKFVYKPKKLAMAKAFYKIVAWINKKSDCEKFKIPKNYYNEEYTIEEYIESKTCETEQEIKRYYKRLGQFLGIVYQLNGNDFHYENVIANGEFPYLIDLETIFTQPIPLNKRDIFDYYSIIKNQDSIINTCFLPSNTGLADEKGKGIDISALSNKKQKLPYKILSLVGDIDNPKFEYIDFEVGTKNNIPLLNGEKVNYENYKSCIEEGFTEISKFIIENKFEFLKQLNMFQGISVRQLIRNTNDYFKILEYASHPKYTMDMASLEKMLYFMWEYNLDDKRCITSEIEDLIRDDIPLFRTITTSKDLIDSKGKIIKNYFEKSAFNRVKEKIINFNKNELNKQLDYLNISLNNSSNVINRKSRMKNNLYEFNKTLLKDDGYINSNIMLNDINSIIESFFIKYKDECICPNLINGDVKLDFGFKKGLIGIYYYLYMNNSLDVNIQKIRNVFSNEKIISLSISNNKLQDLLDLLNIIERTFDNNYNEDVLTLRSNIIKILNEELINNKVNLLDTIKFIKIIGELYKTNKSYELKKTILKLKNNLEIKLLQEGLITLKYNSHISTIDLLECIDLIKDIYPNEQFSFNLDYINKINSEYFEQIYNLESLKMYSNEEYRNIIRSLSINLNNTYIERYNLKQCVFKVVNENEIDENIICILDILISCYTKSEDKEIKSLLDKKFKQLVQYYTITNNYPVDEMNYFKNLSIGNGISGIGYEILRYRNNKIPDVLNLF